VCDVTLPKRWRNRIFTSLKVPVVLSWKAQTLVQTVRNFGRASTSLALNWRDRTVFTGSANGIP
jgi:hypothetical protein